MRFRANTAPVSGDSTGGGDGVRCSGRWPAGFAGSVCRGHGRRVSRRKQTGAPSECRSAREGELCPRRPTLPEHGHRRVAGRPHRESALGKPDAAMSRCEEKDELHVVFA